MIFWIALHVDFFSFFTEPQMTSHKYNFKCIFLSSHTCKIIKDGRVENLDLYPNQLVVQLWASYLTAGFSESNLQDKMTIIYENPWKAKNAIKNITTITKKGKQSVAIIRFLYWRFFTEFTPI